jgi:hypothetical protein
MPGPSVDSAFLVEKDQCVGIEVGVGFTLAADMNQYCSVLALEIFKE